MTRSCGRPADPAGFTGKIRGFVPADSRSHGPEDVGRTSPKDRVTGSDRKSPGVSRKIPSRLPARSASGYDSGHGS